jgi:hypothetical protein
MRRYRGKGNWSCDREECEPGPFCFMLLFYRSSPSSSYDASRQRHHRDQRFVRTRVQIL